VKVRGEAEPATPPPTLLSLDHRHGECRLRGEMEAQDQFQRIAHKRPCLPRKMDRS
jgi:hypothetical protein